MNTLSAAQAAGESTEQKIARLERKLAAAQERLTEPAVQLAIERELEEIVYLTKELAAALTGEPT